MPDPVTVVLLAAMHGDEPAPSQILRALVDGPQVIGLDLWVVPTYNPDGVAAGTRQNARGVDLNRNFPNDWRDLDGRYESGAGPASEPETQAVMDFLDEVDPSAVLGFHQPLYGVDSYKAKSMALVRALARETGLPIRSFPCGGVCRGTFTGWLNANTRGRAVTVEFDAAPRSTQLTRTARAVLKVGSTS